jgi:hypothetical protein
MNTLETETPPSPVPSPAPTIASRSHLDAVQRDLVRWFYHDHLPLPTICLNLKSRNNLEASPELVSQWRTDHERILNLQKANDERQFAERYLSAAGGAGTMTEKALLHLVELKVFQAWQDSLLPMKEKNQLMRSYLGMRGLALHRDQLEFKRHTFQVRQLVDQLKPEKGAARAKTAPRPDTSSEPGGHTPEIAPDNSSSPSPDSITESQRDLPQPEIRNPQSLLETVMAIAAQKGLPLPPLPIPLPWGNFPPKTESPQGTEPAENHPAARQPLPRRERPTSEERSRAILEHLRQFSV